MVAPDTAPGHDYDVFISYSHADRAWVRDWLLPRLRDAGLTVCIDHEAFDIGVPALVNMENAVAASRHTLLVLTPAWVKSDWTRYEEALNRQLDPSGMLQRSIPLLRRSCKVPARIASLTYADLTGRTPDEGELKRLMAALRSARALPDAPLVPLKGDRSRSSKRRSTPAAIAPDPLAALPLDRVPDVAPLPPGSRMPLRANPLFVGRADDLMALAAALKRGATTAISPIAAATGLGGIGKTQLASEFVHRYGQYFAGGVCWLSFADARAITAEVAACGGPLGMDLPGFDDLKLDEQLARVRQEWLRDQPRLLVFDNCEDPALLTEWQPTSGGCRVLLTSRRSHWERALDVHALPLGVLRRPESIALLHKFRPDLPIDDSDLAAIAEALGDLPLALHLAGSFLETYQHERFGTPAAYLAQLHTSTPLVHPSLQGAGAISSPTAHDLHVARTFELSYGRLDATDATDDLARKLLARATHFAAGIAIPRDLLAATLELGDDDAAALQAAQAIQRLLALGLLEQAEEGGLRLHPLLALFARAAATNAGVQAAVERTLLERANELNNAGYPAALLALQPHLRRVTDAALARADEHAADLCNELGSHLHTIGDYAAARSYFERALAIREQVLGPEHPATATSLSNLGVLLQDQGDYAAARPYYERALAIREQVLGPEHPATSISVNTLGYLLQAQGDYEAARPYFERALAIREQVLGANHPYTATSLNNLGMLLDSQGDYAAARPYLERALAIREQVLGPEHPATAFSLNNLGALLQAQGDYAAARPYLERALAIREQVLGATHPDTAFSLNNLGVLLDAQGDYAAARPYYERALAIYEQVLGTEHPDTARSLNNLGMLLHAQGDDAGARPYYERALAICMARLGADHPRTRTVQANLAALDADVGDPRSHAKGREDMLPGPAEPLRD